MMKSNNSKSTGTATAAVGVLAVLAVAVATPAPAQTEDTTWNGLVIAPEARCSPYDSDDYRYNQSVEDRIIRSLGGIYGPYTGRWFGSKRETDIEHIVARSEAHDSGLCRTDQRTRRQFSEDLRNLTLAAPSVNRNQKRDHDAAGWLPPMNRCWFAARVINVKRAYGLTVDRRERDALARTLSGCADTEIDVTLRGTVCDRGGTADTHDGDHRHRKRRARPVRRQRQRPDHVRRGAAPRDCARPAEPPGVPVHAGRRQRWRGLRVDNSDHDEEWLPFPRDQTFAGAAAVHPRGRGGLDDLTRRPDQLGAGPVVDLHTFIPGEVTHPLTTAESKTVSTVATAEDLKALYERQLRYDIGNLGLGSEERRGFWQLLSASRHMQPGEFHEENHAQVWLWSDLHLGHAMTISVFGRPEDAR